MPTTAIQQIGSSVSFATPKILCVDDEAALRESMAVYLEDSGFEVFEAENGAVGLELVNKIKPDLILSDLDMPVMGGLEFIKQLSVVAPDIPVLVISGAGVMKDAIEALRLGAWDYLLKPISDMTILEHAVCKSLERARLKSENEKYRSELEAANQQLTSSLEELKADQKAGRSVQQKLLPRPSTMIGNISLTYQITPSLYLSGDFTDYIKISDDKLVFYVADVSGHGSSSAFITVWLKSLINQAIARFEGNKDELILSPSKMLKHISDEILGAKLEKYLTMVYCLLDTKENSLLYSIGGHHPAPILWDGEKSAFMKGGGYAVGIYDKAQYDEHKLILPPKFKLAMFSDGILEVIPKSKLDDKEKFLLARIGQLTTLDDIFRSLKFDRLKSIPDDVTVFLLSRGEGKS